MRSFAQFAIFALSAASSIQGCSVDRSGLFGAGGDGGGAPDAFVASDGGGLDATSPRLDGAPPLDAFRPADGGPDCVPTGPEICDAAMVDEDCDGTANAGCQCTLGMTQPCTPTLSYCEGTQSCVGPSWGDCAPITSPPTCNGLDDDCDGTIDEGSSCATSACAVWTRSTATSTSSYLFCESSVRWSAAQTRCAEFGYTLVTINDAAEDADLQSEADRHAMARWWIGYNDANGDGAYGWDGEASPYRGPGAPGSWGECAVLDSNANDWGGTDCSGGLQGTEFFLCEAKQYFP